MFMFRLNLCAVAPSCLHQYIVYAKSTQLLADYWYIDRPSLYRPACSVHTNNIRVPQTQILHDQWLP